MELDSIHHKYKYYTTLARWQDTLARTSKITIEYVIPLATTRKLRPG